MDTTTYRLQFNPISRRFGRQLNFGAVLSTSGATYHPGDNPSQHHYTTTDPDLAKRARAAGYTVTTEQG